MARTYQIISADGHIETPPDVWVKYVPEKWRNRAPRLIKLPEGGEGWIIEGQPMLHNGKNISGGRPVKFRNDSYWNPDGTPAPGAGPAAQRLREQDQDGIDAEVLFPPVYATRFVTGIKDREVYLAMVQAYNTWLAQDYCAVAPDRLIGNGVIPVSGIDDAINELRRCKELGLRTVSFLEFPNGGKTAKPEDDRFWETALNLDMRLSPHGNFGASQPPRLESNLGKDRLEFAAALVQRPVVGPMYTLVQLILTGAFDRFPELKLYFAETMACWMPASFYMVDDSYEIYKDWFEVDLPMKPSAYIRRHCYFGIIRDPLAMQLRDHLPAEILMWGSDHPHSVCSFPESHKWLEIIFDGVPAELRRRILLENPAEFFGLDLSKAITETPPARSPSRGFPRALQREHRHRPLR
jgi:predicted TIM-barrel fold metal-dependent hydrolase